MKKMLFFFFLVCCTGISRAQSGYDSITFSRFLIREDLLGKNWPDTLKAGHYNNYIAEEKTVWRKPVQPPPRAMGVTHPVLSITDRVKKNGTADVAKCFIPRHSINYYKGGTITRYLLICFECDGLRFSDDPNNTFVKSVSTREKQMAELKNLFAGLL
jgi:hypothetical protein